MRVHIICEGLTVETFVNEVLGPYLTRHEVFLTAALVGKPGHKGGAVTTARMTRDIKLRLLGDRQAWCTTFFDFYGLDSQFVGKAEARLRNSYREKAQVIEAALREQVLANTDDSAIRRFIPYIQMHEFEGLLFSAPAKLAAGLYVAELEPELTRIRQCFKTSKR
ncbi:MAG: DUF4276 family protein [Prosthecobacter sp.]|nr:DUF4276 family protein [Prosthecobacter sp.]